MGNTVGKEFMLRTRYAYLEGTGQSQGHTQPELELPFDSTGNIIKLPEPDLLPDTNVNFLELVEMRSTSRKYSDEPITLANLSQLLWCTQGVKLVMPDSATFRTVPSAGARHAFETYLLVNNVEGLKPGLYRFLAIDHKLIEITTADNITDEVTAALLNQQQVKKSAVTFIWTAVTARMTWRYGERGYRYLHLDAGHVCQNLYLTARILNCGACAIAAFDDEQINQILGIDGQEQFVIYAATVGK
ncbi:SagB/ThcOx family dehydrogenase [Dendrosporobacter sp. 1207_IL3150]|uniref:SagB/ThcOx family dehydrogenase n=1 Tax=Dendrosporobacter sp. 1207_IL3150 TaxID=3084054 RepID=UPI002FD9D05C